MHSIDFLLTRDLWHFPRSTPFTRVGCGVSALAWTCLHPFKTTVAASGSGQDWQLLNRRTRGESISLLTAACAACAMFSFVVVSAWESHGPHPSFVLCLTYLFLSDLDDTCTHARGQKCNSARSALECAAICFPAAL